MQLTACARVYKEDRGQESINTYEVRCGSKNLVRTAYRIYIAESMWGIIRSEYQMLDFLLVWDKMSSNMRCKSS